MRPIVVDETLIFFFLSFSSSLDLIERNIEMYYYIAFLLIFSPLSDLEIKTSVFQKSRKCELATRHIVGIREGEKVNRIRDSLDSLARCLNR